ncbi:hypothetical protein JSO19_11650 [Leucobacter sp. UCMA 4100]|uniref:hypothetical protein n=1 Tax=Leucobacter sp. UCMA 4100 TaxID=2810534 RepID=UPI0022EA5D0B|nr:hypothetical protein [Leucobacter sp. UCMA 4100]MDA3148030.1 hypothetical protein [Leucobacter sp. UCMA 4100]
MQLLSYLNDPRLEQAAPLPTGSYRSSPKRVFIMVTLGLVMTVMSVGVLWLGFSVGIGSITGTVCATVGAIGAVFFGVATLIWPAQALVVESTEVRSRIPLPGAKRVSFSEVHAVIVFPVVTTQAGNMQAVLLLGSNGRPLFRLSAPPYPSAVLAGLPPLVHQTSGAPVLVCQQPVTDTALAKPIHFPGLVA